MMKSNFFLLLLIYPSISSLMANDSVASLSGRGIVLEKSTTIRMKKEFLHITPEKVNVSYVFLNDGPMDIETTVAFPHDLQKESPYSTRDFSSPQFNEFKVSVNGQKTEAQIKAVVKFNDEDITNEFLNLKIPTDHFPDKKTLSKDILKTFIKKGWFRESDPEQQNEEQFTYSIQRTHFWKQRFPKNIEQNSHHEYAAILGGDSLCTAGFLPLNDSSSLPEVCCSCALQGSNFSYILTTGNNWKNGIEEFELLIEGASIIVVKMNGLTDFDLNSYHFKKKDFKPTQELHIEYLKSKSGKVSVVPKQIILKKKVDGPANCRTSPQGKNVLELPDNSEVVLRERKDDWYQVEYGERLCWTHRKNLRFTQF